MLRAAQSESFGRRRSMANFPAVVDLHGASLNMGLDVSRCLTKARGGSQAFYSLQHARRLSVNEMCRLQGLDSRDMNINLTRRQMGHLLGNGFTCTVLARVLVSAIQAEEGPRAATGAPPPAASWHCPYAYDTPLHDVSAIGRIRKRGQFKQCLAAHPEPPLRRRRFEYVMSCSAEL